MLLHLSSSIILQINEKAAEETGGQGGHSTTLAIAGFLSSFFIFKYITRERMIHWEDDKNWEQRFLEIAERETFTLGFMNIMLNSYAMELSNNCMKHFQSKYESLIKTRIGVTKLQSEVERNKGLWENLLANRQNCISFFDFVSTHGFISKFMMNSNYAMFYFRIAYLETGRNQGRKMENFMSELEEVIRKDEVYRKIDQTHQNYFYITINFFLDSNNEFKTLKNRQL